MPAAAKKIEPIIPPIADDIEALKGFLLWCREHHFSPQGAIIVARVSIGGGIIDEHPRRQLEQRSGTAVTVSADEMDAFR